MKNRILLVCSTLFFFVMGAVAQVPTAVFDGTKLSITVPSGNNLRLQSDSIQNEAIRNSFDWKGRDECVFMGSPEPYESKPIVGLSIDESVTLKGVYNNEPIKIKVEMRPAAKPEQTTDTGESSGKTNILLFIIVGAVLVVFILAIILLRKKKQSKDPNNVKYDPNVISIIKDESVKYNRGLKHVKDHLNEYLTFDMDTVFADTAVNKVYMSTALVKKLYDFFSNSLEVGGRTNETGCFIIGCWDLLEGKKNRYDISLEYMVEPGDDADFGEYSLHFGKKISINMASIIDNLAQKTNRDYLLTCWMHSHPGLGLFLSNHDLIVQKQLTYSDHKNRLLAIVIDTNTPELKVGFFTAKADGTMNNKEEVKRWFSFEEIYRQGREQTRSNPTKNEPEVEEFAVSADYFNVKLSGNSMDYIGFAPHAINQIDTTLYASAKGVVGYFFGDQEGMYMKVGCCLPYENEEKSGCLIFDDKLGEAQLGKYVTDLTSSSFFVNCTSDDRLIIWAKNEKGSFEKVGETTLTQMKEWIRRKRV